MDVSERLMMMKLVTGECLISGYVTQVGQSQLEKVIFWNPVYYSADRLKKVEMVVLGGDSLGHF